MRDFFHRIDEVETLGFSRREETSLLSSCFNSLYGEQFFTWKQRTICCKLLATPTMSDALHDTSKYFAHACNHVLKIAIKEKTHNAIKLHKLCYAQVRKLFGLSSNLSVRSIRCVVEEAKRHNCGVIRMEQLKDIRTKIKTWNKHLNKMVVRWSFYQLQRFVQYKAGACGISVEFINPAYTSQTCHQCFNLGSRSGEQFNCLTCGEQHADVNVSHVIAMGRGCL